MLKNSGCSKTVRSSHPQKDPTEAVRLYSPEGESMHCPLPLGEGLGEGCCATPHTAAFEDGGEMAVFQQPAHRPGESGR